MVKVGSKEVEKRKNRPLDEKYAVIFLNAMYFSLRRRRISKEPIYVALGVKEDGRREILGWWLGESEEESASIWDEVFDACNKIYTFESKVCNRAKVAFMLRGIYREESKERAREALEEFKKKYQRIYPKVVRLWEENFDDLLCFYEFPFEIRRFIYTTNQLKRLFGEAKRRLKVMKILPDEENAEKILFLIFFELNEKLSKRKLLGFEFIFFDNTLDLLFRRV